MEGLSKAIPITADQDQGRLSNSVELYVRDALQGDKLQGAAFQVL